ncbi:hypothetical protein ACLOJK_026551 [Asimina triloba]
MGSGDKNSFYNCSFLGLQDTLWDNQGRHFFAGCYVEGAVDFIFVARQSIYEVNRPSKPLLSTAVAPTRDRMVVIFGKSPGLHWVGPTETWVRLHVINVPSGRDAWEYACHE